MKVIIDRFEGKYAVVETENGEFENMPRSLLPKGACEGDVVSISVDKNETENRKSKIKNLMDNLFED